MRKEIGLAELSLAQLHHLQAELTTAQDAKLKSLELFHKTDSLRLQIAQIARYTLILSVKPVKEFLGGAVFSLHCFQRLILYLTIFYFLRAVSNQTVFKLFFVRHIYILDTHENL